jgi:hypothetical protein
MKTKVLLLTLLVLISVLFSQCRKKGKLLGNYTFTTEDLNIVPYQIGGIINLVDNLGDSIKIHSLSRKSKFYNYYDINNSDNIEYDDYYYLESNTTDYSDSNVYFRIGLSFTSPFSKPVSKKIDFNISISLPLGIGFFNEGYFFKDLQLSDPNGNIVYLDTLELSNKLFHSVYALNISSYGHDTIKDYIKTLYYNITQGIVGLKTKQNKIWCLNN